MLSGYILYLAAHSGVNHGAYFFPNSMASSSVSNMCHVSDRSWPQSVADKSTFRIKTLYLLVLHNGASICALVRFAIASGGVTVSAHIGADLLSCSHSFSNRSLVFD